MACAVPSPATDRAVVLLESIRPADAERRGHQALGILWQAAYWLEHGVIGLDRPRATSRMKAAERDVLPLVRRPVLDAHAVDLDRRYVEHELAPEKQVRLLGAPLEIDLPELVLAAAERA